MTVYRILLSKNRQLFKMWPGIKFAIFPIFWTSVFRHQAVGGDLSGQVTTAGSAASEQGFTRIRKKRKVIQNEESENSVNYGQHENNTIENNTETVEVKKERDEESEQVVVKADPGDFQGGGEEEQEGLIRGQLAIRSDLLRSSGDQGARSDPLAPGPGGQVWSEKGRCHFCSLLCPGRPALTAHLKEVHQPPKHSLCENCENFFHICAIQVKKYRNCNICY